MQLLYWWLMALGNGHSPVTCGDKDVRTCGYTIGTTFCFRPCPMWFGVVFHLPRTTVGPFESDLVAGLLHTVRERTWTCGGGKLYQFCPAGWGEVGMSVPRPKPGTHKRTKAVRHPAAVCHGGMQKLCRRVAKVTLRRVTVRMSSA